MKPKNCKAGQRVIIKENTSGVEVGAKGVILEDNSIPYVAILEGVYEEDSLSDLSKLLNRPVVTLWNWEIKKDKDYPELGDIKKYVDIAEYLK